MATSSLNNFTVPSADGPNQGLLMPKLKYRFRAIFLGFGGGGQDIVEMTKQVMDIKRPTVNFNPITLDVYNSKVYLQGKPEWSETSITLRDDAGGNVSSLVASQLQKQFDFLNQSSAASGADYKFVLTYEVLDGGNGGGSPGVLETWELLGCFIQSVDYADMSYSSNDPATIALTIKYDNAIQTQGQTLASAFASASGVGSLF